MVFSRLPGTGESESLSWLRYLPKPTNQTFDIHAKLRSSKSHWSYLYASQPHQDGFNYQFNTTFIDGVEFAVYERIDNYFVLVDFFKSYYEACDDAKKIIDAYPDIKKIFEAKQETY